MIKIMAYMVIVGLVGFLRLRMKYDRLVSWLMFFAAAFLFIDFSGRLLNSGGEGFSFLWNTSQIGNITIDFHPEPKDAELLLPLFFISLITILHNNIFRYEEKKSAFNALVTLNFVSLSLLVCAENCVQLITAVFITDILGYLILKDVDSSRRYVVYNFFADMCLFMVLALACGKLQSLDLNRLPYYEEIGRHQDFVGLVTTIALLAKTGCFMFQSYLLDLHAARFQRMSAVNMLFAPLAGIIVLLRLNSLVTVSDLALPLLKIMGTLTMAAGIVYFVAVDNIKKKLVYLNMGFIGFLLLLLVKNGFAWSWLCAGYYVAACFFNLLLLKIYLYQNHEVRVSEMLNSRETNSALMNATLMQLILAANVFFAVIWKIAGKFASSGWIWGGGAAVLAAVALVLNQIYRSPHTRRLESLNPNPLRPLSFVVNFSLLIYGSWVLNAFTPYNIAFMVLFLAGIVLLPLSRLRAVYGIEWLQKEDLSKSFFFYALVTPLMYISRTLWLLVDFVFSEKIITAGLSALNRLGLSVFFKINRKSYMAYFVFILLGFLAFIVSFYRSELP